MHLLALCAARQQGGLCPVGTTGRKGRKEAVLCSPGCPRHHAGTAPARPAATLQTLAHRTRPCLGPILLMQKQDIPVDSMAMVARKAM